MALMATVEAVFLRWPQVAASRIPTRSLEHLGKPTACLRTMHFRISCGRPDPSSKRGLWGHGRVCPALSGTRPSRWRNWLLISTIWSRGRREQTAIIRVRGALHLWLARQTLPVAHSLTPTRFPGRLERPAVCPRIMRCRTSCGPPNVAADIGLRTISGCVRHCRADHTNGGAFGSSCAPHECVWCVWGNKPVLHIQFRFGMEL